MIVTNYVLGGIVVSVLYKHKTVNRRYYNIDTVVVMMMMMYDVDMIIKNTGITNTNTV